MNKLISFTASGSIILLIFFSSTFSYGGDNPLTIDSFEDFSIPEESEKSQENNEHSKNDHPTFSPSPINTFSEIDEISIQNTIDASTHEIQKTNKPIPTEDSIFNIGTKNETEDLGKDDNTKEEDREGEKIQQNPLPKTLPSSGNYNAPFVLYLPDNTHVINISSQYKVSNAMYTDEKYLDFTIDGFYNFRSFYNKNTNTVEIIQISRAVPQNILQNISIL